MAAFVNQVQGRPVAVLVRAPGLAVIVLGYHVRYIQVDDGLFQVVKVRFVRKLRVMIANDNQTFVFILIVPFPQRGNYIPAINSTKGPHIDGDDFAT
jgi:hypothetical protein